MICQPGSVPFAALGQALLPELRDDEAAVRELIGLEDPELALSAMGRWRRRHEEVLLIVDQFEELFTQNPEDVQSQFALAKLYEQGQGVPQNYIRAHLFYNLAGSKGLDDARTARDALAAKMSLDQVAEAQRSAFEWQPAGMTPPGPEGRTDEQSEGAVSLRWSGLAEASMAVLGDELAKLNSLLVAGTDPNVRLPGGQTLLLQAIRNSSLPIIDRLIQADADVNAVGPAGWTPLKVAIYGGRTDVAKRLLKAGADPGETHPDGLDALALAQRLGYAELAVTLRR